MNALVHEFQSPSDVARTDVAPYWRPVGDIIVPYDGVDEVVETRECGPYHEKTCPGVPGLKMPGQWDEDENEAEE
jgi:hypothetical protein